MLFTHSEDSTEFQKKMTFSRKSKITIFEPWTWAAIVLSKNFFGSNTLTIHANMAKVTGFLPDCLVKCMTFLLDRGWHYHLWKIIRCSYYVLSSVEISVNTLSTTDNLCKQFGPRSGQTDFRAWSRSKRFDNVMVFLKFFLEKVDFEKKKVSADVKKSCKITQ